MPGPDIYRRSVMLILFVENVGNFQNDARDGIVVLTHIRVGHYCYICIKGFLRPSTKTWHSWLTFFFFTISGCRGPRHRQSMIHNFNSYIDSPAVAYWKELCLREGTLRHFDKGEDFFSAGQVARYFGYIKSGTLKYVAYGEDGTEHVIGLEFSDEFVADFPFSFRGQKARSSVIAETPCEIYCLSTATIGERMQHDHVLREMVMISTEAVFSTVYDRYKDLHIKTPQQRYNELISLHPDLFSLFPLKDIASFLNITQTHLSRLRKNI